MAPLGWESKQCRGMVVSRVGHHSRARMFFYNVGTRLIHLHELWHSCLPTVNAQMLKSTLPQSRETRTDPFSRSKQRAPLANFHPLALSLADHHLTWTPGFRVGSRTVRKNPRFTMTYGRLPCECLNNSPRHLAEKCLEQADQDLVSLSNPSPHPQISPPHRGCLGPLG